MAVPAIVPCGSAKFGIASESTSIRNRGNGEVTPSWEEYSANGSGHGLAPRGHEALSDLLVIEKVVERSRTAQAASAAQAVLAVVGHADRFFLGFEHLRFLHLAGGLVANSPYGILLAVPAKT